MDGNSEMKIANMISGMMPKEVLVEMLNKGIVKWRDTPTDKNFQHLASIAMLINFRAMQDTDGGNIIEGMAKVSELIDEVNVMKKLSDRMKGETKGTKDDT